MPPELIVLGITFAALCLYAVLGGADFGAGVWEFTNVMQSDDRERKLIAKAIGPVWEANHVWLIFVLIIILNGFPTAFAAISRALWMPLLLALAGIVFRGAGFIFRAYAVGDDADWMRESAGAIFAFASTSTPFFMGMAIGALSSGEMAIEEEGAYTGNHLHDWITPLSIYSGILAVGMCAYLASVYLTREASMGDDAELLARWRGRALATGIWIGILAWLGLLMCWLEAPLLWSGLVRRGWPLMLGSMLAGVGSLFALRSSQFRVANLLAALAVAAVIVGWGLGQYPLLVPPSISIQSAKSPDVVLWAMAICILIGALIMFPALAWLFWLFKSREAEQQEA